MGASSDQQPDQTPLTRDSVESDSPSSFKRGSSRADVIGQLPVVAAPQNGDKTMPAGEEEPDMQEFIMALVATNSSLDDVVARLTTELAQAKAAFKSKETAYHHQIETLQGEKAVFETNNTALDSEIHMLRAENTAVNEAKEQYCLANEQLRAANSNLDAENTTLRGEIEILLKENSMFRTETKTRRSHSDKLETVNTTLKAKNASLQKRQNTMKRENRALRKELKQLNQVHADILPFVRDQYAVALRTLVDGVMYLAGWPGTTERGAFVLANGPRIMGFFGNRFSVLELVDIVTNINHQGNYHAHMASGGAIAHFTGSSQEEEFLKSAFAFPKLFKCDPEYYQPPLPGWDKFLSVVNHRLTIESREIGPPGFALNTKRVDSEPDTASDLEDTTNKGLEA